MAIGKISKAYVADRANRLKREAEVRDKWQARENRRIQLEKEQECARLDALGREQEAKIAETPVNMDTIERLQRIVWPMRSAPNRRRARRY